VHVGKAVFAAHGHQRGALHKIGIARIAPAGNGDLSQRMPRAVEATPFAKL
jgi:hypothetical protein